MILNLRGMLHEGKLFSLVQPLRHTRRRVDESIYHSWSWSTTTSKVSFKYRDRNTRAPLTSSRNLRVSKSTLRFRLLLIFRHIQTTGSRCRLRFDSGQRRGSLFNLSKETMFTPHVIYISRSYPRRLHSLLRRKNGEWRVSRQFVTKLATSPLSHSRLRSKLLPLPPWSSWTHGQEFSSTQYPNQRTQTDVLQWLNPFLHISQRTVERP